MKRLVGRESQRSPASVNKDCIYKKSEEEPLTADKTLYDLADYLQSQSLWSLVNSSLQCVPSLQVCSSLLRSPSYPFL